MSSIENKQILANNIRRFLDAKGKNPRQMAIDLDLRYTTVNDWVNAKSYPRIDKVELMANYFGVKKSDLIEDKTNKLTPSVENDVRVTVEYTFDWHLDNFPFTQNEKDELQKHKQDLIDLITERIQENEPLQNGGGTLMYTTDRMEALADFTTGRYDISSIFDIMYPSFGLPTIDKDLGELMSRGVIEKHTLENTEQKMLTKLFKSFKSDRTI